MTPESPAPLTPTTPEERVVMRAYCEAATPGPWTLDEHYQSYIWGPRMQMIADDGGDEEGTLTRMRGVGANLPLKDNGIFIARVRIDFPRVLADLEWALERIANAPHAPSCYCLGDNIPPHAGVWIGAHDREPSACNCWKSEVRGR